MTSKTHSSTLRTVYDDMIEAYEDAKLNENVAGQERLAKIIQKLAKDVKDHELHEGEVITRKEADTFVNNLCAFNGEVLKQFDGKLFDASLSIIEVSIKLQEQSDLERNREG